MNGKHFCNEYVSYWKERVEKPLDGSKVADDNIIDFYIKQLNISESGKVLDLGCGFGRLYGTISKYSNRIVGIDISEDMLIEASNYPYDCLFKANAESTGIVDTFFDHIIIWGTFDVLDQETSLFEFNRILKNGGNILITGKNYSYDLSDEQAFIAERNAKLKGFPNHFTDILTLRNIIKMYGFKVLKGYAFQRRGDLGENKYIDITDIHLDRFYEYAFILEKNDFPLNDRPSFSYEFSEVAKMRSRAAGYNNIYEYFLWQSLSG